MKHYQLTYLATCCGLMLGACTHGEGVLPDDDPDNPLGGIEQEHVTKVERVNVTADDLIDGTSTRTAFDLTEQGLAFSWLANDTMGIFPLNADGSSQVRLVATTGSGTNKATFTGGGWALRSDITYAAYYPWKLAAEVNSINLDYTGQAQKGNGSLAHLGKHDFMATEPTIAQDEALNFHFKHLNAVAQINVTMPVAVEVDQVSFCCSESVIWSSAQLTLGSEGYSMMPGNLTNRLNMAVSEVASTETNKRLTFYMNLPPVDLSAKMVYVVVRGTNNRVYQSTLVPRTMESGKAYRYDATVVDVTMQSTIDMPSFSEEEIN